MRAPRGFALCALLVAATAVIAVPPARAAFFGLFGGDDPPAPTPTTLPYSVEVTGAEGDLKRALENVSALRRLIPEPPQDGEALAALASSEWARMTDAAWGSGHYDASVTIKAGEWTVIDALGRVPAGTAAALDRYRGAAAVPLRIVVTPGPEFKLRNVRVLDAATNAPFDPRLLPPRVVGLAPGAPARSAAVIAAESRILDHFRDMSRPLVKVVDRTPVVVHSEDSMDLTIRVDPGPVAPIGHVGVRGAPGVDPQVIRSFIYAEPGDPYSRRAISDLRRSVARIEALGGVRVIESETLDARGMLPLEVDVTERAKRSLAASARYSTTEGPGVRGSFTHRNLFGEAERLRIDADLFYVERTAGPPIKSVRDIEAGDFGSRLSASFLKPALSGTRNDLLVDAMAERDRTEGYTSRRVLTTAAVRHRWSDRISAQAGIEGDAGQTSDPLGYLRYRLVGLPVSGTYDSTDSIYDPTEGIRATASVTPFPTFLGSTVGMTVARARASTYYKLDEAGRYVIAAQVGTGSIFGADVEDIPANRRFYAGGAGSVRGYTWRSLSPLSLDGRPVGGRSIIEASLEARIRVTPTIGVVPFVDVGTAYGGVTPQLGDRPAIGAGVGLRYQTGFGPVRVDLAVPLDRRRADKPVALYVGFGQSF